jgi:hypothetical protein
VLLLAIVPSAFVTILLLPVWSWVESRYGIESVGHSGPADWCFFVTYAVVAAAAGIVWGVSARRGRHS